ncbi:MAG: ABC transporter six-transmembrane domain-containing protein [Pseudomonadota bacterium]
MIDNDKLTLGTLLRRYGKNVLITWLLLIVEVALLALIPLFLGKAIDALLAEIKVSALYEISVLFVALIIVAVARRAYDTRAYGTMRVHLCMALVERSASKSVSTLNARVEMGRELADFLEDHTPLAITCILQVVISVAILFSFGLALGAASISAVVLMLGIYAVFHGRFFKLNAGLNAISEEQVGVLASGDVLRVQDLFTQRRVSEVKLSDADSIMYGGVYVVMFALILANLWSASALPVVTVGAIFAIISYSWELVGASVELPATLQQWTRLREIQERINR